MSNNNGVEKTLDPKLAKQSIVDMPDVAENESPHAAPLILSVAALSQTITPWGRYPRLRDQELRGFWPTEPWLASVIYSVAVRNASFAWEIVGSDPTKPHPKNTARAVNRILKNSDAGRGWKSLILKTCTDLYTQDNGAFWYIVRRSANSPVINIIHLDAARCQRTGDPKYPVIYTDRKGNEHVLKYWQIRTIEEMPSPIENAYNIQYCAVSRCLLAAEIVQSIAVYKNEKISGKFTRAIDIVSGITKQNIDDAQAMAREQSINQQLYRYMSPIVIPGIDPGATLSHVHIDLASLPDNFDEDASLRWYVAQLAAAFGVDYQEIAPLMSGNLGSSQQSEIMHLKTRGKGPALIMGILEDTINNLIPSNVEFRFKEQDVRSEKEKAEARFTRAKERSLRVEAGEIDKEAAREIAVEAGDLPLHMITELEKRDEERKQEMEEQLQQQEQLGRQNGVNQVTGGMRSQNERLSPQENTIDFDYVDLIRRKISDKASINVSPSGTVILGVRPTQDLIQLQRKVMLKYKHNKQAVFMPVNTFHVTLVYASLIDDFDFDFTASDLNLSMPQTLIAEKLSYFDTPNGKAIIVKIKKTDQLVYAQRVLYDRFEQMGVVISDYSKPANWEPHITLGYVSGDVEENDLIVPMLIEVGDVHFTRSDYYTVNTIYTDLVGENALDD